MEWNGMDSLKWETPKVASEIPRILKFFIFEKFRVGIGWQHTRYDFLNVVMLIPGCHPYGQSIK